VIWGALPLLFLLVPMALELVRVGLGSVNVLIEIFQRHLRDVEAVADVLLGQWTIVEILI
jgi:hypothetical protein